MLKKWNEIPPGTKIHDYTFDGLIGSGGYAQIYKIYSPHYKTEFVAKVMPIEKEQCGEAFRVFQKEIDTLMKLDHPNIIQLYDHFFDDQNLFLILEYCPTGSIFDLIHKKELGNESIQKYTTDVLSALQSMHDLDIVHHDIKPANFLIDTHGRAKLTDFGLSFCLGHQLEFGGSFAYSAPEVIQKRPYDPKLADIWSLGISVFQMFTGRLPWFTKSKEQYLTDMVSKEIEYPETIPDWGRSFISACLQVQPTERLSLPELKMILPRKPIKIQSSMRGSMRGNLSLLSIAGPTNTSERRKSFSKLPKNCPVCFTF